MSGSWKRARFTERIELRVREGTRDQIAEAAEEAGVTPTDWIRRAIRRALEAQGRTAGAVLALAFAACTETAPVPPGVTGTYTGTSPQPGAAHAAALTDSTRYRLRIMEDAGLAYGVLSIIGDTLQPTDPWDAVISGVYIDGRLVLEYQAPERGQCHLVGPVESSLFTAEHRCEVDWSAAETLELAWVPSVCPPGSEVWRGLSVCDEGEREGYDRNAFGTGYRSLEDEIIASLPKNAAADSVYTPYTCQLYEIEDDGTAATDIDHVVALAEAYDSGLDSVLFRDFGKDLANLTVADPTINRHRKSDNDAAEWRPAENAGWYAARIHAVKLKYGMSINAAERDSLAAFLTSDSSRVVTCP